WFRPNIFSEECNLRVNMAALRRSFGYGQGGNRYVATIPGRGYRFVAAVSHLAEPQPLARQAVLREAAHNLPVAVTRMVGRAAVISTLASQVPQRRFITITGAGGVGKTTGARAGARERSVSARDGVRFVDLGPVADPVLVASALASMLGVAIRSENPLAGLIAFLRDKQMLLVLDSCERAVEATATLAEEVYNRAPGVH